uniref:Cytidyltransferase-like domain-containing protein n=1 Tax=viral metagenome TaxID=1070528 RepID=A0A6C0DL49_9ZZZZ
MFNYVNPEKDELIISNKPEIKNRENSKKKDYLNKLYEKPWGHEYLTYQNDNIGIWILHFNKNCKTSVHCHFKKDTLLIVLNGTFRIDKYNGYTILNENEIIYFPASSFHGIMSYIENGIVLEIEIYSNLVNYSDKNDLLRLRDAYNRDKDNYESSVVEKDIKIEDSINFHNPKEYIFENTTISIKELSKNDNYKFNVNDINILLKGKIYNGNILSPGSLINANNNINFLDNNITYMSIINIYKNDKKKIIYSKEHLTDLLSNNVFKNIGLTSGCFDIFHKGHINNLKLSKVYCDKLFVCLSSDKQIKQLKGEKRPINNLNDRLQILINMSFIDYIILYDEIDNKNEIELDNIMNILKPDFWFKGSDYKEVEIRNKHPILKNVLLFENVVNVSTSTIINKIQNN